MSADKITPNNRMPRIFTIGETTYDILFKDGNPSGGCGGGSAFNSAISLGRCGLPVSLISTFGKDRIGDLAFKMLDENKVDVSLINRFEGGSRVALAFFDQNQNPEYSFYPASVEATPNYPAPLENDIILLGSSFALRDTGRDALLNFLKKCRGKGCIIIYDPNARKHLAHDPYLMKKIMENISLATIVKGSDEDFRFIINKSEGSAVYKLIQRTGPRYLFYTKGHGGAELFTPDLHLEMKAKKISVVSSIGAGDNYSAGIVFGLFNKLRQNTPLNNFNYIDWNYIMALGNSFAANVCQSSENYISLEMAEKFKSGINS